MPELNSVLVLAASHFILETFPDKWPFTFLWGALCGMRGFKAAGHLWWLENTFSYKLRSASRSCAHSSRCVPCSRIQGSPSPSSSRLVETVTPAPPALLSWRHLHTPGQGLGSVPRVVFSLAECTVLGNLKRRYSEASSKITPRRQKYPLSAPSGLKSDYWEVVSRMRVATKFLS